MKKYIIKGIVLFDIATLFALGSDQVSKFLAAENLQNPLVLIEDILKFVYQENSGVAFSISIPLVFQIILFPLLTAFGIYLIIKYLDNKKPVVPIVAGLIFGGAVSNFIDRIIHGYVIDYISVSFWPVFNLADIFITGGIFFMIIFYDRIKQV